jgi:hypothetical protein
MHQAKISSIEMGLLYGKRGLKISAETDILEELSVPENKTDQEVADAWLDSFQESEEALDYTIRNSVFNADTVGDLVFDDSEDEEEFRDKLKQLADFCDELSGMPLRERQERRNDIYDKIEQAQEVQKEFRNKKP